MADTNSGDNSARKCEDRPLHYLVGDDKFYELVESLLEDPNQRHESSFTLLHTAVMSPEENFKILQLLVDKGADVNSRAEHDFTPLHVAVACRKRKGVSALLDAGASVNCRDDLGRTPLHFAIRTNWGDTPHPSLGPSCDLWILERLLSQPNIDLDAVNKAGITPLMWAVIRKNAEAVEALLKKGADPNITDSNNQTSLHLAFSSSDPSKDIICDLLWEGADIYCHDKFGRTPMDLFLRNLLADDVAQDVVRSIVLRHRVRETLLLGMKKINRLYKYYEKCVKEVRLMKSQIVYRNFSLHDFACGRCPLGMDDPLQEVFVPVVKVLLSAPYPEYEGFILKRMTKRDLCRILGRTSKSPGIEKLFENSKQSLIFWGIKTLYFYPL